MSVTPIFTPNSRRFFLFYVEVSYCCYYVSNGERTNILHFLCHLMMQVCWTSWTVTIFEFHRHLHHLWQWPRRDTAPFGWRAKSREWPKLVPKHCSNQFFGRAFISWSSQGLFQLVSHSGVLTLPALADRVPPAKCRRITFGLFHEWMNVPDFWVRMHTRSHSKQTDYGGLAITQTQTITATQPTIHPESWPQVFHLWCRGTVF